MNGRVRQHIRGNIYGILAVFIALGGTAVAASKAPKNSVGSKSIRNGAVKANDVDPATVQLRVGGSCSPGQAIRAVARDGTVTCEAGQTVAGYDAAAPLTVTGNTFGLNPCGNGLILKFSGGSWGCAADANTTYTAILGEGLHVSGTTVGIDLCGANQILKMNAGGTSWACAADG